MKARGFPWLGHRSLAEVAQTEAFIARMQAGSAPLSPSEAARYGALRRKAENNNPPLEPRPGAAA